MDQQWCQVAREQGQQAVVSGSAGQYAQPGAVPQIGQPSFGALQSQAVLDQFEALTLGPAAPGQPGDAGQSA